jgi:hypothetical protein
MTPMTFFSCTVVMAEAKSSKLRSTLYLQMGSEKKQQLLKRKRKRREIKSNE